MNSRKLAGLIMFWVVLTAAGCAGGVVYLYVIEFMPSGYLCIAAAGLYACMLGWVVKSAACRLCIPGGIGLFITAAVALLAAAYVKWSCFFGLNYAKYEMLVVGLEYDYAQDFARTLKLMVSCIKAPAFFLDDLVLFNSVGTWGFKGEEYVFGARLGIVWALESAIITGYPLYCALKVGFPSIDNSVQT